jgi:hypothetical protein
MLDGLGGGNIRALQLGVAPLPTGPWSFRARSERFPIVISMFSHRIAKRLRETELLRLKEQARYARTQRGGARRRKQVDALSRRVGFRWFQSFRFFEGSPANLQLCSR